MKWLEATIETNSSEAGINAEIITAALFDIGITGIETIDNYELRLFLESSKDSWDYADEAILGAEKGKAYLRFYIEEEFAGQVLEDVKKILSGLKSEDYGNNLGELSLSVKTVDDTDWEHNWKQYYKPFKIGKNLVVRPEWEEYSPQDGEVVLSLNPGLVFGTGLHQSTKLVLRELEKLELKGQKALDLGCGSGILAVAAVLLGANSCTAVDIDRAAAKIVTENASLNGVLAQISMRTGNILADKALLDGLGGGYDLVMANIVADVVIDLTPIVKKITAPKGIYISSGIIASRIDDVVETLKKHGFEVLNVLREDEWAAVLCASL